MLRFRFWSRISFFLKCPLAVPAGESSKYTVWWCNWPKMDRSKFGQWPLHRHYIVRFQAGQCKTFSDRNFQAFKATEKALALAQRKAKPKKKNKRPCTTPRICMTQTLGNIILHHQYLRFLICKTWITIIQRRILNIGALLPISHRPVHVRKICFHKLRYS